MKAIILAAGSGKRISKDFPELPKALIQVNNNSIISRQISTFKKNGIDEIIVITSTFKEKFSTSDVTYVDDQKFEEHDVLGSLMEAREHIFGDVIITYSDIIFEDLILKNILQTNYDIGIAVDLDWKKAYENRKLHPISEAENVLFDNSRNKMTNIYYGTKFKLFGEYYQELGDGSFASTERKFNDEEVGARL